MENVTEPEPSIPEQNASTNSPSKSESAPTYNNSNISKAGLLTKCFPCWSICFSSPSPPPVPSANNEESPPSSPSLKPSIDSHTWCSNYFTEEIKHTFAWTIYKFSHRKEKNGDKIESCNFTVIGNNHNSKWRLKLYPNGDVSEERDYVSVYLENQTSVPIKVSRYHLAIIDKEAKKDRGFSGKNREFLEAGSGRSAWGFRRFVKKERLERKCEDLLPHDSLTIQCDLYIAGEEKQAWGTKHLEEALNNNLSLASCHMQLAEDLKEALEVGDGADMEIGCGGKVFPCHRYRLSLILFCAQ